MNPLAAGALLCAALPVLGFAAGRAHNRRKYKIRTPEGVQTAENFPLGGIGQYVRIRGWSRANPVLLVLHGGPGSTLGDAACRWQGALERHYTVVHWDQRGCGNTDFRAPGAEKPTLERLLSDLDQLVDHLRTAFGQERVLLMGHSWGTLLGALYAARHPEKTAAFLAVSPMLDFRVSERLSAQEAARRAREAGREGDARAIEEELTWLPSLRELDRENAGKLLRFRQRKEKYLPAQYGGQGLPARLLSPDFTAGDLRWMLRVDRLVANNRELYRALLSDGSGCPLCYKIPVIVAAGELDWTTPYILAADWFHRLSAPAKEFLSLAETGHLPFQERPEYFAEELLAALRRIT